MNKASLPLQLVFVALSLVALGLVSLIVPFSLAVQAYFLAVIYLFLRNLAPVRQFLAQMPQPHLLIFALLIGGVVGGHFTLNTNRLYPFVSWAIFPMVDERDPVTCRELIGTTQSGKQTRLLVEQLFPSIIQFNLPQPLAQQDALTPTVVALARVYDQLHPDDPLTKIEHVRISIPLHPAPETPFPICENLQTYSFAPSPSN